MQKRDTTTLDVFRASSDDRAVSPVIGVILMVGVTVILAAVIGAFVLQLGGSVSQQASAGVTVSDNGGGEYQVTVTSLGDSTNGVRCVTDNSTYSGNEAKGVGESMKCDEGASIIAFSDDSDVKDRTIRTSLGG